MGGRGEEGVVERGGKGARGVEERGGGEAVMGSQCGDRRCETPDGLRTWLAAAGRGGGGARPAVEMKKVASGLATV